LLFQLKIQEALRKKEKFQREHEEVSFVAVVVVGPCDWRAFFPTKFFVRPFFSVLVKLIYARWFIYAALCFTSPTISSGGGKYREKTTTGVV
jgi:hypothetical protein